MIFKTELKSPFACFVCCVISDQIASLQWITCAKECLAGLKVSPLSFGIGLTVSSVGICLTYGGMSYPTKCWSDLWFIVLLINHRPSYQQRMKSCMNLNFVYLCCISILICVLYLLTCYIYLYMMLFPFCIWSYAYFLKEKKRKKCCSDNWHI